MALDPCQALQLAYTYIHFFLFRIGMLTQLFRLLEDLVRGKRFVVVTKYQIAHRKRRITYHLREGPRVPNPINFM
jgi:hypothetical protein